MLARVKSILFRPDDQVSLRDEVPAAAAALFIECAVLDGGYDDSERSIIARLLADHFNLSADGLESLIMEGEEAVNQSVELYGITRVLKDALSQDERLELMVMLWQVVYADGKLHDYEASLVRRVAGLLHVPDKEAGMARKKALECLDINPSEA